MNLREQFVASLDYKTNVDLLMKDNNQAYIVWLEKRILELEKGAKESKASSRYKKVGSIQPFRHDTDDGPCECGAWHRKGE